ncbi:hypothetical protein [Cohnella soli]|uniref:DUF4145 domain-containing protein n=1 Tax=Cohnella soli TaxID=425005 RepID=A0ABW0HVD0_9BACL
MEHELDLFENAIDSLQHGLAHYMEYEENQEVTDIKQAIMNLVNSIDLMILEKLRRFDEEQIYESEQQDKYGLGYRKTIHVDKAYRKIRDEIDAITTDEFKAYEILKILRNSATHASFTFGSNSKSNIVFLLHYIARFLEDELETEIDEFLSTEEFHFYNQTIKGMSFGEVLQDRIDAAIEAEIDWLNFRSIKDGGTGVVASWPCHECSKVGISVDEDLAPIGECAFCGHKHKVGVCEVCSTEFDPDWDGLVDEETGLELCEYHSDSDNYD